MQMMSPEAAAAQHPCSASRAKEAGIQSFRTADGQLMLGVFRPRQYSSLAKLLAQLGHPVAALDGIGSWDDVWAITEGTKAQLAEIFLKRPTSDWLHDLRAADLPAEPVKTLAEAVENPQLKERGYFQPNPDGTAETLPLTSFRMSEGGPALTKGPPKHGQHSMDVLREAGLCDTQIADLMAKGVIK